MSEPATSNAAKMAAVSESKPAGAGAKKEKPRMPSVNRQQNGAALQQLAKLLSRDYKIVNEESKQAVNKLTLRVDSCEKSKKVLHQVTPEIVTEPLGINLDQILHTPDSLAGPGVPSQAGSLIEKEEEKVAGIAKTAILRLYGITKFIPKDHGIKEVFS
ncbi:hypothetical protein RSOL_401460, partial [Rhizoctonia solani AG-3 Rhs1AP]